MLDIRWMKLSLYMINIHRLLGGSFGKPDAHSGAIHCESLGFQKPGFQDFILTCDVWAWRGDPPASSRPCSIIQAS